MTSHPDNKQKKTTSEKPVSLKPLNFKAALKALLGVKPKEKVEDQEEREQEQKEEKTVD